MFSREIIRVSSKNTRNAFDNGSNHTLQVAGGVIDTGVWIKATIKARAEATVSVNASCVAIFFHLIYFFHLIFLLIYSYLIVMLVTVALPLAVNLKRK